MAKGFAFTLRQRVVVPGYAPAQGVVTKRMDQVSGDASYYVETLTPQGLPTGGWISEASLRSVNQ